MGFCGLLLIGFAGVVGYACGGVCMVGRFLVGFVYGL